MNDQCFLLLKHRLNLGRGELPLPWGVDLANVIAVTVCTWFFIPLPLKQVTEMSDASNTSVDLLTEQLQQKLEQGLGQCLCLGKDPQATMGQILPYLRMAVSAIPVLVPVSFSSQ